MLWCLASLWYQNVKQKEISHKLRKAFSNFYSRHFELIEIYNVRRNFYHVPTVPPNIHSITAIANMYNLFLKHSLLSHAFVCQDCQLTECFLNTYINDETKNQNNDMRMKYCLQPLQSRSTLKPLCLGNVHVQLIPYQWTNVY